MSLGVLENKILKLVDNEIIDIAKVEELFKQGANPNALESEDPDIEWNGDIYYSTFFSECIFEAQYKEPDLYPLLKVFIEYGLDVEKYGASIIGDFHYIYENSDIYEMTKLILNSTNNKIDLECALSNIGIEESYRSCSMDDIPYGDESANDLFGLYELLEAYKNRKKYNGYYRLNLKPNQKFINLKIVGDFVEISDTRISVKSQKRQCNMKTKIQMENDCIIVEDNYAVYINNEDEDSYVENEFTIKANQYFVNEKIIEIKFEHYRFEKENKNFSHGRVATIIFTNGKQLVYIEDLINDLEIVEIK